MIISLRKKLNKEMNGMEAWKEYESDRKTYDWWTFLIEERREYLPLRFLSSPA